MSTPRKTSEIIADLRAAAAVFFSEGQTSKDPDEHFAYLAHAKTLREAADRLENASAFDAQSFASRKRLFWALHDSMFWLKTLRDAIADGSIDEMVKK